MVGFGALLSLLAATASLLAPIDARNPPALENGIIRNQYIVEVATDATKSHTDVPNGDKTGAQDGFLDTVQSLVNLGIGINIEVHLNYKLFQGVLLSFQDDENAAEGLAQLESHESVKNIWANTVVPRPRAMDGDDDTSPNGIIRRDYQTSESQYEGSPANAALVMTQVDKLHKQGVFGNGTRVCDIGNGVDYTLAALGGGFGAGHVISFGRDHVGDTYAGYPDTPQPDDDPFANCTGHGTGTMGIMAAQPGNEYGMIGVAPGATYGAYRVYSCVGDPTTEIVIQALNAAYEDGCQVITVEVIEPGAWKGSSMSVVASRIVEAGVPVIVSPDDYSNSTVFHIGQPAAGDGVSAVGSVNNQVTPDKGLVANFTVDNGAPQTFKWRAGTPAAWGGVTLPLWTPNFYATNLTDHDDDCAKIFPPDTPDLSGYVVLLHDRNCDYDIMAKAAAGHGANYIIIYNSWPFGKPPVDVSEVPQILAAASVRDLQGIDWLKALAAGSTVTVEMADPATLSPVVTYSYNDPTAGLISAFSDWGPTYDLDTKPQFTAPGGNVLIPWTVAGGGPFKDVSGTSFSAPFAAGVYALLVQARGTADPATLLSVLSATAKAQVFTDELVIYPLLAPVFQQGAGTICAFDAAYTTTILSRSSIAFNDTDHFNPNANFTIRKLGKDTVTFNLGHAAAVTSYTFAHGSIYPQRLLGMDISEEHATIEFNNGSQITVPAGGEAMVEFTLTPPAGLDPKRLPMYSGWVTLNGTNGENLSLPYTGAVGSMKKVQIIDEAWLSTTDAETWRTSDVPGPPVNGTDVSFLVPYNETDLHDNVTYPAVWVRLAFGSAILDMQLIRWDDGAKLGSIGNTPRLWLSGYDPGAFDTFLYGNLFDGTMGDDRGYAPESTYVIQVSALKRFGDRSNPLDYEYRRTPPFKLSYTYGNGAV